MSENEVATTGGETTTDEQPTAQTAEKPKKAKATATKQESPAGGKLAADEIMATIKNMTVLELADLVKALETEFGVSAAAPAVAAAPVAEAAAGQQD